MADDAPDEDVPALAAYVHADPTDTQFVSQCATTARQMVSQRIGSAKVPPGVVAQAVLEVGSNLWHRRLNARDQSGPGDVETTPAFFRPALDPMTPAWPILRPYLGVGIA